MRKIAIIMVNFFLVTSIANAAVVVTLTGDNTDQRKWFHHGNTAVEAINKMNQDADLYFNRNGGYSNFSVAAHKQGGVDTDNLTAKILGGCANHGWLAEVWIAQSQWNQQWLHMPSQINFISCGFSDSNAALSAARDKALQYVAQNPGPKYIVHNINLFLDNGSNIKMIKKCFIISGRDGLYSYSDRDGDPYDIVSDSNDISAATTACHGN